ncbi:polyketide synthase [Fusarium circinatum]|uniref:Polyketide synthase n=1 Tax=Fusarium circinatum TaxID=48490 RepID=A0A8H5TR14_FUSCI|nr:polyketide synthase [Fusarium circinatum]
MSDVDSFDHQFFKTTKREAAALDSHQRLLLQATYHALESAGWLSDNSPEGNKDCKKGQGHSTGCFIGMNAPDWPLNLASPLHTIDTACSSPMLAVHQACSSLRLEECTRAVAGGANLITNLALFVTMHTGGFLSKPSACNTFNAAADGYCRGEAVGVVVLQPLPAALADKDDIHGVTPATGNNQNMKGTTIINPALESQAGLYRHVLKRARLSAKEVSYVEAHGTGTRAGDPVEMGAIRQVLDESRRATTLHVDSLKANIGHSKAFILYNSGILLFPAVSQGLQGESDLILCHAAMFAIHYSSGICWLESGLDPQAVCGQSFGEWSAATVSGVMMLKGGMKLVTGHVLRAGYARRRLVDHDAGLEHDSGKPNNQGATGPGHRDIHQPDRGNKAGYGVGVGFSAFLYQARQQANVACCWHCGPEKHKCNVQDDNGDIWVATTRLLDQKSDADALRGATVYKMFSAMAKYSAMYRCLRHLAAKGGEAAGDIIIPTYILDPVIGMFPGIFVHSLRDVGQDVSEEEQGDMSYICTGIGSVRPMDWQSPSNRQFMVYARIVHEDQRIVVLDVYALDKDTRRPAWSVKALQFARVPRAFLAKALPEVKADIFGTQTSKLVHQAQLTLDPPVDLLLNRVREILAQCLDMEAQ